MLKALEGPPWSEIAGHITACEALIIIMINNNVLIDNNDK